MSFGGFGGSGSGSGTGGFGSNNNSTPGSGFGGFGSNPNSGFGANNNTGGFGSSNPGGGLFGSGGTTSGFGSNPTGGFGSTNNAGAFGAKPGGFGTTSTPGGGMFGSSTTSAPGTGFGGFGSSNASNTSTSTPFGGGAGSSLFGSAAANKPTFGSTATGTTGGVFGNTNTNTGTTSTFGGFGNTAGNASAGLGSVGDPPGTANVTNFQPLVEKENSTSAAQNSFQSILFQDAFKKWSSEELRLVDYNAGRRYGGASGSSTFGVGSGFGSFGSGNQPSTTGFGSSTTNTTAGGLFGNTPTTGGFGQTNPGTNAFGSSTGGGIFGNKPATTGGLFGNAASTPQQTQSGGVFGNPGTGGFGSNTTGSAFGSANSNAGGGLFGNNQNTQNKPGFSFGNAGGFGSNTNSGFGSNTNPNTGGGLFGNTPSTNPSSGLFGGSNQQPNSGFGNTGGFGTPNQQQQQQAGGFLGSNQQKPAGTSLFGNTSGSTGGGLLGTTTSNMNTFGQANNAQTGGGLFGNKPATGPTGGLFGATNTQSANTGGGLFGSLGQNSQNQQQQSQQGGSLFGSLGQNQQKPSLFGGSTQSTGAGLFGGQNTQQQGSIFGSSTAQQPQTSMMGSSLFGNSQGIQSNPSSLTASVNDPNAYGSLFANFGGSEAVNPGPLATPMSKKSTKRPSILPYYKLNPASASRFVTPQKRGYGLSYSTYGTPNSNASVSSTPGGLSQSMLGSSLSRNLGKSVSASNLRRSLNVDDSVLVPGAFSAGSGPKMYNNGSVKKLVINKDLRSDLFSTPTKDKSTPEAANGSNKSIKRVSFDTSNVPAIENGSATNGSPNSTPSAEQLGYVRPKPANTNGSKSDTSSSSSPEMEKIKGNELATVPENEVASPPARSSSAVRDGEPGDYWMSPTKDQIQNMNRVQRQSVADLTVGRENIGYVKFKVPVDLTSVDLDTICEGIVVLTPRSATVYPNPVKKPPVGKGLNVPALINLENAFPRASRTGKAASITKHVERLKKIVDTKFENYNANTGEWTFSVEHFTTYGLDEDDDEDVTAPPATGSSNTGKPASTVGSGQADDPSPMLKRSSLPGTFEPAVYDDHGGDEVEMAEVNSPKPSFLANRSAGSASHALVPLDQAEMDEEYAMSEVNDDASDHLGQHLAAEHNEDSFDGTQSDLVPETPAGIMRARMRAIKVSATPVKVQVAAGDDWLDMLGKTISPQKRNRALLKSMHEADNYRSARDSVREASPAKKRIVSDSKGFATSIDLMNSLFEKAKAPTENLQASIRPQGVKWPYKRASKHLDESDMDGTDRTWHGTMRPTWGPGSSLIFSSSPGGPALSRSGRVGEKNGLMTIMKKGLVVSESQDIRIAKFTNEMAAKAVQTHSKLSRVCTVDGIPAVELQATDFNFKNFIVASGTKNSAEEHEQLVWELASILFDELKIPAELVRDPKADEKIRRENLSKLWESMVEERTNKAIIMAHTPEEKSLAALSGHRIAEACKHLLEGKNFRLATLLSLMGSNDGVKKDMKEQLREWQVANVISEFSQPIRALYEMLSGNVCVCDGTRGSVENRTEPFLISKRFGLNWQQAFGLRLWYATSTGSSIAEAVEKYREDVEQNKELQPVVWFMQQGIPAIWDDPQEENREDLLWGLLKLYADPRADLEAIIRPENSQLSPVDYRLCWQLVQGLAATGRLSYTKNMVEKLDATTISFAAQLTNEGTWLEAVFVLLHLTDPTARTMAIQDHLCRHASLIGGDDSTTFKKLAVDFQIPTQWIWHSKALYMRSVKKDPKAEVQCLLRAESWAEAHQTFIKEVAPRTIIERDYDGLAFVLQQFECRHSHVPGWNVGGEVYKLFLQLIDFRRRAEEPSYMLVNSLLEGLPVMHGNTPQAGVIEYAALTEMAAEVAKVIASMANAGEVWCYPFKKVRTCFANLY
ncbi:nuclear protein 96-domain-containing protein [Xylaria nigripes]|nr:nuclear protein 96-domain-containing protein [Xylaria nigripes]